MLLPPPLSCQQISSSAFKIISKLGEVTENVQQNLQPNKVKLLSIILIKFKGSSPWLSIITLEQEKEGIKRLKLLITFQIVA